MSPTKIDIKRLKEFAFSQIPSDWPLREILMSESDELDAPTFLARLPVYLKLLKMRRSNHVFSEK
jgi:hypothetical protein